MRKLLATVLLSLVMACSAEPPGTDIEVGPDAGVPDDPENVTLTIDPTESSTAYDTTMVTGHGPAGGRLIIDTTVRGQLEPKAIGNDGSFCVDVPLLEGAVNTIKFEAVSAQGVYSDPVYRDITQEGQVPEPGEQPGNPMLFNAAKGATHIGGDMEILEGSLAANMVDGSSTFAHLRNTWFDTDWIVFQLPDKVPVHEIRLLSDPDCHLESYSVLLSNSASAVDIGGNPEFNSEWEVVVSVWNDGTANDVHAPGTENWALAVSKPQAEYVAVYFRSPSSGDCNPFFGRGTHKVIDLMVMTEGEGQEPPTPGAQTCSSR